VDVENAEIWRPRAEKCDACRKIVRYVHLEAKVNQDIFKFHGSHRFVFDDQDSWRTIVRHHNLHLTLAGAGSTSAHMECSAFEQMASGHLVAVVERDADAVGFLAKDEQSENLTGAGEQEEPAKGAWCMVHEIKYRWGAMGTGARRIGFGMLNRKAMLPERRESPCRHDCAGVGTRRRL